MNKILSDDINMIILNEFDLLNCFNNSTFLITGATGLVYSFVIKLLISFSIKYNANIKIYAISRNKNKQREFFQIWIMII